MVLAFGAHAQSLDTFDISSFQPPKGWTKQTGAEAVRFSIEDKTGSAFCLIALFKSVPGPGSPKENFDAAWATIVKEAVPVSAPQMIPADNKGEWLVAGGFASFYKSKGSTPCLEGSFCVDDADRGNVNAERQI